MSQIIVLKVAGSASYTIVDRAKGTVEEVDAADLAGITRLDSGTNFSGLLEAYAIPELIEISSRKHCVAA